MASHFAADHSNNISKATYDRKQKKTLFPTVCFNVNTIDYEPQKKTVKLATKILTISRPSRVSASS